MKKIVSLGLVVVMAMSAMPMAYATTAHTNGTQVEYVADADANRAYTITVPAKMTPKLGQAVTGTVTLSGKWASNETVTVIADAEVELTNSINENDKHTLAITFPKMEYAGDNTEAKTYTETVTLAEMPSAALFGEWTGKFNYTVEFKAPAKLISFTIDGQEFQAEEGMTWGQFARSQYDPNDTITMPMNRVSYNGKTIIGVDGSNPNGSYGPNDLIIAGREYTTE